MSDTPTDPLDDGYQVPPCPHCEEATGWRRVNDGYVERFVRPTPADLSDPERAGAELRAEGTRNALRNSFYPCRFCNTATYDLWHHGNLVGGRKPKASADA